MTDSTIPGRRPPAATPPTDARPTGPPGFELLEEVGRGGMGAVYRAWDAEFGREVAVKLLRPDLPPGTDLSARFRDEARITGQLQHPNIPPVYRVGTAPDGRPFLAMRLIHGKTLAAMLAGGEPVDAAAVFEATAQAVGYAHAHGVVHRDLKPSNVMVGGFGEVQVMDWGLAKLLTPDRAAAAGEAPPVPGVSSQRDAETLAGSVLGTPGYMAPEQAAGRLREIDARTDVFGLGGILCALLTGGPPFPGETAESARRRAARGDTEDAFARLDASGADPGLVELCKRCLALAPDDRPSSGNAVADAVAALRRAAEGRAVQAERDRAAADERAAQAGRRRRLAVAAAGVLVLGVVGTTVGLVRAEGKRAEAEAAREEAGRRQTEAEAARRAEAEQKKVAVDKQAEADEVATFFENHVFEAAGPTLGRGHDVSLRAAVEAAVPVVGERFAGRPLVEARLRKSLGLTLVDVGDPRAAEGQIRRAVALGERHLGPDHVFNLQCQNLLGSCLLKLNRSAEAAAAFERAIAGHARAGTPDHKNALGSRQNLGAALTQAGRPAEAVTQLEAVAADLRRVNGPDAPASVLALLDLGNAYAAAGRPADALRVREEAVARCRRAFGPDHPATFTALTNLAISLSSAGRRAEALSLFEDALAGRRRVLGPDHPETLAARLNVAIGYSNVGRRAEALAQREEAVAGYRRVLGPDHPETLNCANGLANSLLAAGRKAEALRLYEETLAGKRRSLRPDDPGLFIGAHNLAEVYAEAGRVADALKLWEEALAGRRRVLGPDDPNTVKSQWRVAHALAVLGRGAEAVPLIDGILARPAAAAAGPAPALAAADIRLEYFQRAKDPAGVRGTADLWEKLGRADPDGLFAAARYRAAAGDADRAMSWLTKAVAAGRLNRGHAGNADLAPLRGRADFQQLVASLPPEPAPPPRPGR
jgi:tetratricopeptide (TPR) repeat protein/predicted Ser/Thr protein kinase